MEKFITDISIYRKDDQKLLNKYLNNLMKQIKAFVTNSLECMIWDNFGHDVVYAWGYACGNIYGNKIPATETSATVRKFLKGIFEYMQECPEEDLDRLDEHSDESDEGDEQEIDELDEDFAHSTYRLEVTSIPGEHTLLLNIFDKDDRQTDQLHFFSVCTPGEEPEYITEDEAKEAPKTKKPSPKATKQHP